jgi:hypothetical protein
VVAALLRFEGVDRADLLGVQGGHKCDKVREELCARWRKPE